MLEAIYILGNGKSFRSNAIEPIVNSDSEELVIYAKVLNNKVGIKKHRNIGSEIRINGQTVSKVSELARLLPVHFIEPNSIAIVEGSPSERRKFIDFTMFHVEHSYLSVYRDYQNVLKQRNALLKSYPLDLKQLDYWDNLFIQKAIRLNKLRKKIFSNIVLDGIQESFSYLITDIDVSIDFVDGCRNADTEDTFTEALRHSRTQDLKYKSSQVGPHRADILLRNKGKLAKDYLSRGQKKLVTYGVRLAPALMLAKKNQGAGIVLIDDMPSELDIHSVRKVCNLLKAIGSQTVLTSVDKNNEQTQSIIQSLEPAMFHVEHGTVQAV